MPPPAEDKALIISLEEAPTAVDRFKILLTDNKGAPLPRERAQERLVFDFNSRNMPAPGAKGESGSPEMRDEPNSTRLTSRIGGAIALANIASFPALTGLEISTAVGFLGACGMNTPHTHPRATEFLTVVEGTLESGFILENGFTTEQTTALSKFQGTVFPMGSIHYQFNPSCEPSIFVAALNSQDPGVSQVAQNFFGLNGDVVNATLGFPQQLDGKYINAFRTQIPANVALGIDKCLQKCGIKAT